jgi:hypothetical protein
MVCDAECCKVPRRDAQDYKRWPFGLFDGPTGTDMKVVVGLGLFPSQQGPGPFGRAARLCACLCVIGGWAGSSYLGREQYTGAGVRCSFGSLGSLNFSLGMHRRVTTHCVLGTPSSGSE